ncbi:hypothetical protein ACU5EH_00075 [Aliivibrio salmonicida]|uniref:hypothetical protein n=1 Tax=Aliivibrio salmonicida TaxID=40269 RepID=UPI00406D327B
MENSKNSKDILNKKCNFQVKITPQMEQEIESLSRLVCTPKSEITPADFKRQLLSNGLFSARKAHNKDDLFKCECTYANWVLPQPNKVSERLQALEMKMDRLLILLSNVDSNKKTSLLDSAKGWVNKK